MKKLPYLLVLLVLASLISCKKEVTYSNQNTNTETTDALSGKIFTIAGNGTEAFSGDGGQATTAEIAGPSGITSDASGNIYIADQQNHRIRKVNTSGIISTIAGNGTKGYNGDGGPATAAELTYPMGLAVDVIGNVYFTDQGNTCNCIRKINTSGIISTIAGIAGIVGGGYTGDGGPSSAAQLSLPMGLAIDGSGNLYIADYGNGRIRRINTSGIISTLAGNGQSISINGNCGDGGPATAAELDSPEGVAVDGSGNIYIADYYDNCIRKVNTGGIISTIAGIEGNSNTNNGYTGDGGPADSAKLYNPTDVVVDGSGNIYIGDADNNVIRIINTSGIISTYAGNGNEIFAGDGGPAIDASIGFTQGIGLDNKGNLYISCLYLSRVRVVYK